MSRRELLSQAFAIVRRSPALWSIALLGLAINTISSLLSVDVAVAITGTITAFLIVAVMDGALIGMVNSLAEGETVSLWDGLRAGLARWMPMLLTNLALIIPVWIVLVLLSGSIAAIFASGYGRPDTFQPMNTINVMGSVFSLAGVVIAINALTAGVGVGAERAIVLEEAPIGAALRRGLTLLRANVSDFLSIALILFGVGLAASLIFGLLIEQMVITFISPQVIKTAADGSSTLDPVAFSTSPAYIILVVISLLLGSLLTAFASSVWTLAFRNWKRIEEEST